MEKVSVVIPIYKGNQYIPSIISMLENNWETVNDIKPVKIEIVFVNDFISSVFKLVRFKIV